MPPKKINHKITKGEILDNLYQDGNGRLLNLSRLEKKRRSRLYPILIIAVFLLFLLTAASWLGFFLFGQSQKFSGDKIQLTIEAPQIATSTEEIIYLIKYRNLENTALAKAELSVYYPAGFNFVTADPAPLNSFHNIWQLGTIGPGQKGEIQIHGFFLAARNAEQTLQATLNYTPANIRAEFQKTANIATKLDGTPFALEITGPAETNSGDTIEQIIKYRNQTNQPLRNIQLTIAPPPTFVVQSAEPAPPQPNYLWPIAELAPQAEQLIKIKGSYTTEADGPQELKTKIGLLDQQGNEHIQNEANFTTSVIKGEITLQLTINNAAANQTALFGDVLKYSLAFQNTGAMIMEDVEIKIALETTSAAEKSLLDWSNLEDKNDGAISGKQLAPEWRLGNIVWDKEQISALAKLQPGDKGSIDFQIKIKDYEDFPPNALANFQIKNTAFLSARRVTDKKVFEVKSPLLTIQLNSHLLFSNQARYFNDDNIAVGTGPLPPVVGQATAYQIFWSLNNTFHDLTALQIQATLPENVSWQDRINATTGVINFDEDKREVIWTVPQLSKTAKAFASFQVGLMPTAEQSGRTVSLLNPAALSVTDQITNGQISKITPLLTTNLDNDPFAEGKGVVAEK